MVSPLQMENHTSNTQYCDGPTRGLGNTSQIRTCRKYELSQSTQKKKPMKGCRKGSLLGKTKNIELKLVGRKKGRRKRPHLRYVKRIKRFDQKQQKAAAQRQESEGKPVFPQEVKKRLNWVYGMMSKKPERRAIIVRKT